MCWLWRDSNCAKHAFNSFQRNSWKKVLNVRPHNDTRTAVRLGIAFRRPSAHIAMSSRIGIPNFLTPCKVVEPPSSCFMRPCQGFGATFPHDAEAIFSPRISLWDAMHVIDQPRIFARDDLAKYLQRHAQRACKLINCSNISKTKMRARLHGHDSHKKAGGRPSPESKWSLYSGREITPQNHERMPPSQLQY